MSALDPGKRVFLADGEDDVIAREELLTERRCVAVMSPL